MGDHLVLNHCDPTTIGQPIHFQAGDFAGRTIRAELREVQKADVGRKYARVDRRPLDPPPSVWLRLFEVVKTPYGEIEKEIVDHGSMRNIGLLCHADLFLLPGDDDDVPSFQSTSQSTSSTLHPTYAPQADSGVYPSPTGSQSSGAHSNTDGYPRPSRSPLDIVWHHKGAPIRESAKMTWALVGSSCIEATRVQYQGEDAVMFVFGDLAVSMEGTFILRYRVFDIFSRMFNENDMCPIQAECYGGSFRVYSTKDFPGLQPSTPLSKEFARWGARVNVRERDRKRGRNDERRPRKLDRRKSQGHQVSRSDPRIDPDSDPARRTESF